MRVLSWLVVLLTAPTLLGAPGPLSPTPVKDRKALREEARRFAQQFGHLVEQVSTQYVRPVPREDLLEAAATGLYQAARRTPPRDLRAQVRQAVSLASMLRAQAVSPEAMNNLDKPQLDPIEKYLVRLREELGDALADGPPATLLAARSLTRLLDTHSGVVSAEEQRRNVGMDHEHMGTGLSFREAITPGPLEVEGVHPGSPAQRAGLRPGDVIVKIDDQPIARASPARLMALRNSRPLDEGFQNLAAPAATTPQPVDLPRLVRVNFQRAGVADQTVTLLRERYRAETVQGVRRRDDNTWEWMADEKTGLAHVRLTSLGRGTADELRSVLTSLTERGARGLVLDLRWCPGGYLNEAVEVADLFLGNGTIATIKNRGREDTVYRGSDENQFRKLSLVVLVNGETSGGAELIAAALQDHGRGKVVGQRTLGKASVQTPLAVGIEGFGFKLTSGTFVRPSGKNLHRFPDSAGDADWGVVPDEDARLSPDLGKRLKQWWVVQGLRPARASDRLPLDDPRADPQQIAALVLLRKQTAR